MKKIVLFIVLPNCFTDELKIDLTFRQEAYREDLEQLIDSIQANHPEPYYFITEKSLDELVEEKKHQLLMRQL